MSHGTQLVYIGGLLQGGNLFFEVGGKSEYVINYIVFIIVVPVFFFHFYNIEVLEKLKKKKISQIYNIKKSRKNPRYLSKNSEILSKKKINE
jgi:hypothetical protein